MLRISSKWKRYRFVMKNTYFHSLVICWSSSDCAFRLIELFSRDIYNRWSRSYSVSLLSRFAKMQYANIFRYVIVHSCPVFLSITHLNSKLTWLNSWSFSLLFRLPFSGASSCCLCCESCLSLFSLLSFLYPCFESCFPCVDFHGIRI